MKLLNFLRGEAFARGVHPPQHKDTAAMPISRLPFAPRLVVPLSQNVGRPARSVVQVGQDVVRGQPLAEADGFVSAPHHAPASGVVEAIRLHPTSGGPWTDSVIIKVHPGSPQAVEWEDPRDLSAMDADDLIAAVQRTGIVGIGRRRFPHPRQAARAEGIPGRHAGGQRLRVRALSHQRPSHHGRARRPT